MTQTLVDFFNRATAGASNRAMAERIGMTHTTLMAQLASDKTPGVTVSMLCRAYNVSFGEAAVAAGWVTEQEMLSYGSGLRLASFSEVELTKEMLRRVVAGAATAVITEPVAEKLIDDVLREVEDAREQGRRSDYAVAADDGEDETPGGDSADDREGL
ncbi:MULTISPECIES: hypothetical protein [unclassified Cryobacterium]|uniref:hypothetical protein n=1 Tax=unclassified Cryobacterium TaxID=2649013 RepID=UPI002AB577DD|nr:MULTISPECIES: hypothetical protein [unclassified Cryobacterium]MDY7542654.1 hypothetical protein [Cryobacterium sp. 5B3]MEB0264775.1 hypothetical protein [Cryobacterium sp. 10I5]MEB0273747.1 hypothetical protein [Cryobacterium sp. 5B3]